MSGIAEFWLQSDSVIKGVAITLLVMSVFSWTIMLAKCLSILHTQRLIRHALPAFWQASSLEAALQGLRDRGRDSVFFTLAEEGAAAAHAYANKTANGIGAGLGADEFILRTLQQAAMLAQARIESGMTMLASVGSTAPFIGLFGTVWGIYHALVSLSGATQVVLDQVAGPVGEALIMTAAGLFVAIPAVLAYNAFTRLNRLVLMQIDGFSHRLHAFLVAGVKPERAVEKAA